MTTAYVGLGANLGDREGTIRRAAELIGAGRLSTIVETDPWGYENQPRFLNAVAEVETQLTPRRFLAHLLDLDLLLWGGETIDEPGLQVPHPRLHERLFVLEPLAELVPDRKIPGNGTVSEALAGLQSSA